MATIETNKESPKFIKITDIKDVSKVDLRGAKMIVDQVETGGKKGKEEAIQHIKKGEVRAVANYLYNYEGLDSEVAERLVDSGEIEKVIKNLRRFSGLNFKLANKLIAKGKSKNLVYNIKFFDADSHNEIALELLKYNKNNKQYVLNLFYIFQNLSDFKNLDNRVAKKFLDLKEDGLWGIADKLTGAEQYDLVPICNFKGIDVIGEYLESFKGLDKETAIKLIDAGYSINVIKNINSFEGTNYNLISNYLIEHGKIEEVITNVKSFKGINEIELIDKAVELGVPYDILYKNKDNFSIKGSFYIMNNEYNRTK